MESQKDLVLELLEKSKQRIASPDKWTKGANAVDAEGNRTDMFAIDSPPAVKWCMVGAIDCETLLHDEYENDARTLVRAQRYAIGILQERLPPNPDTIGSVTDFNDDDAVTHEDVMRVYDSAIKYRKKNPPA